MRSNSRQDNTFRQTELARLRGQQGRRCRQALAAGSLLVMIVILPQAALAETAAGLADFSAGKFAEAQQEWREAADQGDAVAALYLGAMYDTGDGVRQDPQQALAWYRRAAEGGQPAAMFNLGVMYDSGIGVVPDLAKAAYWYRQAAEKGYGRADYNLGLMYEKGIGLPRNRTQALRLFQSAARHGVSAARTHLVALGASFSGPVRQAEDVSMRYFLEAKRALMSRGPVDEAQVADMFRRAAEMHNAFAAYDLGFCYENGFGVQQDKAQAYEWYRRSTLETRDGNLKAMADAGASNLAGQITPAEREAAGR